MPCSQPWSLPRSGWGSYECRLVTEKYRRIAGACLILLHETESEALRDINLSIRPGEFIVLTGESGCGKTTLTRTINGLIPLVYQGVLKGRVSVAEKPVTEWTSGDLAVTVGSVFQNPRSQFVNSEVEAELAFGCENQGLSREEIVRRIHESVRVFGIEELLHRQVEELSGGQRQW